MKNLCNWLLAMAVVFSAQAVMAENEVPTQFSNMGGIINTRHNLSQSTEASNSGATMNSYRNRYGEVCVYCHTPHGANTNVTAPLWNRNIPVTTYTTYDQLGTSSINQAYNQPGAASLSCLSCHDGQQAVDAIINMPGSGQYSAAANPTTWDPVKAGYPVNYKSAQHRTLVQCMACHASDGGPVGVGVGVATDFAVFVIGTDLTNDHPVGVTYPTTTGGGTDWNTPGGTKGTTKYFDDGNAKLDKNDIRLYDSGNGPAVECATCHDPHGVPSGGAGSAFNKTFLRKTNTGSVVCLTCHVK